MRGLITALRDTVQTTGMVFVIVIGAFVLSYFMALSRLPMEMARLVVTYHLSPYLVFAVLLFCLLVLGCIMTPSAITLLTMPIFFPIMMELGFDPVWLGVIVILMGEIGLVTPPVGMTVYVTAGVTDVPMGIVFKGVLPFVAALFVAVGLMTLFPQICLFLPNMMIR